MGILTSLARRLTWSMHGYDYLKLQMTVVYWLLTMLGKVLTPHRTRLYTISQHFNTVCTLCEPSWAAGRLNCTQIETRINCTTTPHRQSSQLSWRRGGRGMNICTVMVASNDAVWPWRFDQHELLNSSFRNLYKQKTPNQTCSDNPLNCPIARNMWTNTEPSASCMCVVTQITRELSWAKSAI